MRRSASGERTWRPTMRISVRRALRRIEAAAGGPDADTGELRARQQQRAAEERELERDTEGPESSTHSHRAAKAEYLREKLEQRARAERERD
jgi:hypothetical protein